jgi:ribonucleoside-diphosphate reductase alpha chain
MKMKVTKRNNVLEELNIDKIHEAITYACEGLANVSVSEIALNAQIQFYDKMPTELLQDIIVRSATDLISLKYPNYQYVAARLMNQDLRKKVYKSFQPKPFKESVKTNIANNYYDAKLLEMYTDDEIEFFGNKIKYTKDNKFTQAGMEQFIKKYLIEDENSNPIETPQEVFMLIPMYMFGLYTSTINLATGSYYTKEERKNFVLETYKALSDFEISLPTPIMNGVRTTMRQYASCCLINTGDKVENITNATKATMEYTVLKSGIGLHNMIRGIGAGVDRNRLKHTGMVPFFKVLEAATKSCTQSGKRGGSSTEYTPFFHIELASCIELRSNTGTEENRLRQMDHSIAWHPIVFERAKKGEDITLFYLNDVPLLFDYYVDESKFIKQYEEYEKDKNIHKITVSAIDMLEKFVLERSSTGRNYPTFIDNANNHSSFKVPLFGSNLCCEIFLPTSPLYDNGDGEIGMCILGSLNWGYIKKERIPVITNVLVRLLDILIDYQEYPFIWSERGTKARRSIGIGHSDVFHFLAKNKVQYNSQEGRNLVHEWSEAIQFNLIKASVELAKEQGACEWYSETKYSDGLMCIDHYKETVDEYVTIGLMEDWEGLRANLLKYGIRNSTLSAHAPTSNSSRISNSTPGLEPPRELLTIKEDKLTKIKQIVPEFQRFSNQYTTAWDIDNIEYFKMLGIVQKFTDQSISTNQYLDYTKYPDGKVPFTRLMEEFGFAWKIGLKTMYYQVFKTADEDEAEVAEDCDGGACKI